MSSRTAWTAAAMGTACFGLLLLASGMGVPKDGAHVFWLVLLPVVAFFGARFTPGAGAGFGVVLIAVHWPLLWLHLALTGELTNPSTSTGGMVALFIASVWIGIVSPLPILAAHFGGWSARRSAARP